MNTLHAIGNALYHFFGIGGSGPYYGFWSGTGSDVGEVTIFAGVYAVWKHHNCAQKGCPRLGKIVTAVGHKLCHKCIAKPASALTLPTVHPDHQ